MGRKPIGERAMTAAERQRRSRYAGHGSAAAMDAAIGAVEAAEKAAKWVEWRKEGFQPCPHCGAPIGIARTPQRPPSSGGIYRAANFQHLGQTKAETHYVAHDGRIVHRITVHKYAKRHKITIKEACRCLGVEPIRTPPKERWFLWL